MTFNKPATHLYLKWAKDINSHICRQGEICKQILFTGRNLFPGSRICTNEPIMLAKWRQSGSSHSVLIAQQMH